MSRRGQTRTGTPWLWFPYLVTKLTDQPRTTGTRTRDSDGGASSEQENSSSRLISEEDRFDIVGGRPRTGTAEPSRANGSSEGAMGSSETNSEPIDGTVAAASGERVADSQGVTPQYVLFTLMHCTYYTVSLTCTVHCTYYILYTVHTVHVPCFPVSVVCQMLRFHLLHLFRPGQTSHL